MKNEWKKHEKELYMPKNQPEIVTIPKQKYFMISGKGNPNNEEFSDKIGVLYSLAYAVRMMPKQGFTPEGYFEYVVYPLEGLWNLTDEGKQAMTFNKDELLYKIMIRQPNFVTKEISDKAFEYVKRKKPHPLLDEVKLGELEDGLSVQMMHIGSYDNEPESFTKMKEFISSNNLEILTLEHREIYISDVRKTEENKLKTVLRYRVKHRI